VTPEERTAVAVFESLVKKMRADTDSRREYHLRRIDTVLDTYNRMKEPV
jgi:hypothetical protein